MAGGTTLPRTPLPPSLSSSYRVLVTTDPIQVVFGDQHTGEATACGWWARVGYNLTYLVHWDKTMECPTTLYNDSSRAVLPDYFAPPTESSTQTLTPTTSLSSTQVPSSSQAPSQTQSVSPSQTASHSPRPGNAASSAFTFLGLSGPAAVGAVVAVSIAAVVLVVVAGLFLSRRVAGGTKYTKVSSEAEAGADRTPPGGSLGPANASVNAGGGTEVELDRKSVV